MPRTEDTFSKQ